MEIEIMELFMNLQSLIVRQDTVSWKLFILNLLDWNFLQICGYMTQYNLLTVTISNLICPNSALFFHSLSSILLSSWCRGVQLFDCGSDLQERVLILPSHHLCALLYARHRLLGDHSHLINPNPRIKLSVCVSVLLSPKDPVLWCQPMLEMVKSSRPKQPKQPKAAPRATSWTLGSF